jgi:hypothetical protein
MKSTGYQYHFNMKIFVIASLVYTVGYITGRIAGFLDCKNRLIRR